MDLRWLEEEAPDRVWLLEEEQPGGRGWRGWLPRGEVGLLAAPGGTGKSWLIVSLALSMLAGGRWPSVPEGSGGVLRTLPRCGRVALLLAEETEGELRRRLYRQRQQIPPEDRDLLRRALEGGGLHTLTRERLRDAPPSAPALVDEDNRRSAYAVRLEEELRGIALEGGGLDLILIDPLSAFGGAEIETDNHAATCVMREIERLTELPGNPAVLIVHHTRKGAFNADNHGSADDIRGAGGLVARARWAALLRREGEEEGGRRLSLDIVKSNYTGATGSIRLFQPAGGGGALRALLPCDTGAAGAGGGAAGRGAANSNKVGSNNEYA